MRVLVFSFLVVGLAACSQVTHYSHSIEPLQNRTTKYVVSNFVDYNSQTLRQAIKSSNTDGASIIYISFSPSMQGKTILLYEPIKIYGTKQVIIEGFPNIETSLNEDYGDIVIQPNTALSTVNISGKNQYRIFEIDTATKVKMSYLRIINGEEFRGAGIFNNGSLDLNYVDFDNNVAFDNGGAIFNTITGTLSLNNIIFRNNRSITADGGAIFNAGRINHLNDSNFVKNRALRGKGGAIYSKTELDGKNLTFEDNRAERSNDIFIEKKIEL